MKAEFLPDVADLRASTRVPRHLVAILAFAFTARLLTLGVYPLTDNTEARYGEIARKMVETGQWLVPQIDYGVPFWGKPPLSMWLTAVSYELVGVSEFAARMPSLLLAAAIGWLIYRLGKHRHDATHGLRATVVAATTLLMMVSAGGVMTDPALTLGTTLGMAGWWFALTRGSRAWGYAFFVGLAVGLLAKGPIALVLTLAPIAVWAVCMRRVADSWRNLPWLGGTALLLVLVVPWYWLAEIRNPGFLHYFIVGEHFQRFIEPGWKGDLYGVGHEYPRGTIWLFALAGTLPWSPWLLWRWLRRRGAGQGGASDGWRFYLVCWTLCPLVFFTASGNILPTYFLPGLAGFGLLAAETWREQSTRAAGRTAWLAAATPAFALIVVVAGTFVGFQSQREIVDAYRASLEADRALIYFRQRPYSAEFYTGGRAKRTDDVTELRAYLARNDDAFVATEVSSLQLLPADMRARLSEVKMSQSGKYVLLRQMRAAGALPPPG